MYTRGDSACVVYLAGPKGEFAQGLGAYAGFVEKVHKYFVGTMMDARRLLESALEGGQGEYLSFDESHS